MSDGALERIRLRVRQQDAEGVSIIDKMIADRAAEENRLGKGRPSGDDRPLSPKPSGSISKPLRKATLKPDLRALQKRERTKGCVDVLRDHLLQFGIEATDDAIFAAWERHSDGHAASWLVLYDNATDNARALMSHLDLED